MSILKHIKLSAVSKIYKSSFTLLLAFFFISSFTSLKATHIVGGDITYKCLGWSNYEITLTVRRDCEFGEEPFDNTAHVGIYDGYTNLLPWFGTGGMIMMQNPVITTINTDLDQGCAFIGEPVCVTQAVYKGIINLPKRASGFQFAYQRCCRNASLNNIVDPLNTGSTYWIKLPEESMGEQCNSAPTFNQWPDVYICTNQTLNFDLSATDPDGDSLVYKLCNPYLGATFAIPQPVPPSNPPYTNLQYLPPFSFLDPMGGVPLTIDPNTGVLNAVPNSVGQWLVGVCVEEYVNGVLRTTVRRDFEYNTRVCTEGPMASFDLPNPFCDGLTFTPVNTSTDADSYVWTIEPSAGVTFNATDVNPTFTVPSNGVYKISLEAFRDVDGCSTIFFDDYGIYDSKLIADFTGTIESCATDSTIVSFISTSMDPDFDITMWDWTFTAPGFSTTATGETVTVTLPLVDNVSVTLIATSENGCTASVTENFDADPLDLELIASPMSLCAGDTLNILLNPNCDLTYSITPLDFVIFDDPTDPCVISINPTATTTYIVTATNGICTASAEFTANVIDKADLSIVGDSIVCNGIADLSVLGGLSGNAFEWSTDIEFTNIVGDMSDMLSYTITLEFEIIYVRVKDGTGCSNIASFNIYDKALDYSYPNEFDICTDTDTEIVVTNNDPNQTITVVWGDNPAIVSTTDSSVIVNTSNPDLNTTITFTITNEFGCSEDASISLTSTPKPVLDFTFEVTCGTLEMCFTNGTMPLEGDFIWDFGDLTTTDDTSTELNPCYTYPSAGTYMVTLTVDGGSCDGITITKEVAVPLIPSINIVNDDEFLCFGQKVVLNAETNVVDGQIVWSDGSGANIGEGLSITVMGMSTMDFTVTVTDKNGCTASDVVNVEVYIFDLSVDVPEIACVGEEVTVTLTNNSPGDNFTYDWEPNGNIAQGEGTTTVIISANETTDFSVNVTNNTNGCDSTINFTLNISVINKTLSADPPNPYQCKEVTISVDGAADNCTYLWDTGETTSSILDTILQNTTYTVTITDENGCTDVQSISVPVILPNCDESDVFLPNAFTPNGDNINDIFIVRSNFVKTMELVVFNRWGEEIFKTIDVNTGWDGTYKGEKLAPDVYAYCLLATCSNGENYKKLGNVTLLK